MDHHQGVHVLATVVFLTLPAAFRVEEMVVIGMGLAVFVASTRAFLTIASAYPAVRHTENSSLNT